MQLIFEHKETSSQSDNGWSLLNKFVDRVTGALFSKKFAFDKRGWVTICLKRGLLLITLTLVCRDNKRIRETLDFKKKFSRNNFEPNPKGSD